MPLAAILILGAFIGVKRGLARSVVRSVYLVVLLPISYFIGHLIAGIIAERLVERLGDSGGSLGLLAAGVPDSTRLFEVLVGTLITVVLFALFFGIFEALSLICLKRASLAIIKKVVGEDKQPCRHTALFGGLVGLAQGVVVSIVLLLPLCMCVTLMSASSPAALASLNIPGFDDDAGEADTAFERSPVELMPSNQLLYPMTRISDRNLSAGYSELSGSGLCAMDEAPDLINAFGNARKAYQTTLNGNNGKLTAMIRALGAVNAAKGDSRVLPIALTDVLHAISRTVDTVNDLSHLLGIESDNDDLPHRFLTELLLALERVDTSNVDPIIRTLAGDGFSTATMENVLLFKENTDAGGRIGEHFDIVADVLVSVGRRKELRHINSEISQVIVDYIIEADTPLTSDAISDEHKKQLFENVSNEIQKHIDVIKIDDEEKYVETVSTVSGLISDTARSYDYDELTDDELTIASVGIISYGETTDEITPEGIMDYLGYTEEDIKRILDVK